LDDLFDSYKDEYAIIINDLGRVSLLMISNTPSVQYTYLRRIKILNKEGMKYAKVSIEIDESKGEGLTELKARTHKLNGSGEPVSFPINKKKIKLEREKGVKRVYSFEFPFVEEGAILEYTYQIKAKEIDKLKTWKFHTEIPVVRSELQTFIPRSFEYEPVISGNPQQIQIISDSYRARNAQELIDRERFRRNSNLVSNNSLYGPTSLFGNFKAYIMYAVPSLEKEAFSLDREARGNEISLQLRKESFRGKSNAVVFEDWDELNKHLTKSFKPNKVRVRKKRVHEKSTQIRRKAKGQLLIMENCLAATQRQVKWNKKYGLQSINVERAINKRVGNGAEINLYLYHLLKESGLEAYPVTISTRDHGRVNSRYASLAQFNHVIVLVVIDGEEILLDGSSKLERLGMLPQNDLNQFGYVVNQEGGRWITLKSRNKVNRVTYSRFSLNEAGQLNGQISVENREYSVVLEQKKLEEYEGKNDEYLLEEILIGLKDPKIFDRKLAVPENEKDPLVVSCELRTGDYVEVASEGEIIIIKPMMIKAVLQNPFEKAFRNTPVDFPYPLTDSHMIGIRLPEGYEVAQAPSPIRVLLPNDGGSFTYNVLEMGNIIHFTSAIHINQTTYAPEEYSGIRDFFEYVVSKHQEDIVIRKIQ
ncbi:MAG: DUF3857 domain-containing protein, partial [Bacteroidota bacterium]